MVSGRGVEQSHIKMGDAFPSLCKPSPSKHTQAVPFHSRRPVTDFCSEKDGDDRGVLICLDDDAFDAHVVVWTFHDDFLESLQVVSPGLRRWEDVEGARLELVLRAAEDGIIKVARIDGVHETASTSLDVCGGMSLKVHQWVRLACRDWPRAVMSLPTTEQGD